MSIEEEFPIGCNVELINNEGYIYELGTVAKVVGYYKGTLLVDLGGGIKNWFTWRFHRTDKPVTYIDSRVLNIQPDVNSCVKCGKMGDGQFRELAKRCAQKIEERLGWKNFLGNVEKNLLEILPIIIEELCKEDKSDL